MKRASSEDSTRLGSSLGGAVRLACLLALIALAGAGCGNQEPEGQTRGGKGPTIDDDKISKKPPRIERNLAGMSPSHLLSMKETVTDTLGRIGLPAVPALVELLASPDVQLRRQAAATLARIGPDAHEAVPALLVALDDRDEPVRKLAVRALGQIGPAAGGSVPKLLNILEDRSTD